MLVLVTFKHYRIQLGAHQRLTSWSTCNASGPKIQLVFFYIFQDSLTLSFFPNTNINISNSINKFWDGLFKYHIQSNLSNMSDWWSYNGRQYGSYKTNTIALPSFYSSYQENWDLNYLHSNKFIPPKELFFQSFRSRSDLKL